MLLIGRMPAIFRRRCARAGLGAMRMPPQWIPPQLHWENYAEAWNTAPFGRYFFNSFFVSITSTIGEVITTIFAAYAFAKMRFFGKNVLFAILLGTLMIPGEMLLVPNYVTLTRLGWLDSYEGLILPWIVSVFGIFLLRQAFKQVPKELEEAARVEGASWLSVLLRVYIPLARPTYLAYGLVSVSYHWNNFLWPVVITNSNDTRPLTVGLSIFGAPESGVNFSVISAGTILAVSPLLIAFLLFQRQFVQSFMRSGIK